jgi:hypothetical protein
MRRISRADRRAGDVIERRQAGETAGHTHGRDQCRHGIDARMTGAGHQNGRAVAPAFGAQALTVSD